MDIKLIPNTDIYSIIPLLQTLDEQLGESVLKKRLDEMVSQGYQCVGLFDQTKLIGICGIWIITKYYVGKHIEPDNFVILPEYRGQGLGKQMMTWLCDYGRSLGCEASELNCYLPNKQGQDFWESEGYQAIGYHYSKPL